MSAFSARAGVPAVKSGAGGQQMTKRQDGLLRRFRRDQSGTVAMIFGIIIIPLTAMVGLAVDFGRVYSVSSQTQGALDAAALAAGRVAQVETTDVINKASAAATAYFNQAKPKAVISSTLQFSPNSTNTQFTVTATSWVRTPFLGTLNFLFHKGSDAGAPAGCTGNHFACVQMTTTSTAELKAGGDGGSNVEVSLMLDVTGSMCDPCTKIDDAKSAAQDLIDIVIWDDQSQYTSRVALAPFAEAVNAGTALAPLVRGTVTANTQTGTGTNAPQSMSCSDMSSTSVQPTKQWIKFPKTTSSCSNNSTTATWLLSAKCVTERIGVNAYTDVAPTGTTSYVGKGYFGANLAANTTDANDCKAHPSTNAKCEDYKSCGVANYTDPEVNAIMPLSKDKTELKSRIDKLQTAGSTAGHLGTAWAWYLLSPNWNNVLKQAFGTGSEAGPYSDLTTLNAKGAPKLRKIAVLMTDGDYNINYCKGTEAKNSDQTPDINCNSENGKSLDQAKSLCTAMKNPLGTTNAAKIEVFTVGFQVTSTAKTFLKSCATDTNHYYDATTGDALKAAFRDIALRISTLRLTH
jgi:Flp pilus assembly protein TadG